MFASLRIFHGGQLKHLLSHIAPILPVWFCSTRSVLFETDASVLKTQPLGPGVRSTPQDACCSWSSVRHPRVASGLERFEGNNAKSTEASPVGKLLRVRGCSADVVLYWVPTICLKQVHVGWLS